MCPEPELPELPELTENPRDRPELSELVPGLTPGVFTDYREEAKLFIAHQAGLTTLLQLSKLLGVNPARANEKYAHWLTAPICPTCKERCLNFLCPDCMQHNDMPWPCDDCKR